MRGAPTSSEAALWIHLRGGQLGVWFRRQVVIGRFVADFASASAKLVVEVDGCSHDGRGVADARRDRALARLGWRVVRVPAALVIERPLEAAALVREALSR
jgi:very-short-patch-repair endonuclease